MNVLLVDDDVDVADVLGGMLEELGCVVETRENAKDAIERLALAPLPDLVLSDVRMPGGQSGIDLAKRIRGLHPHLPFVLISGFYEQLPEHLGLEFLPKPLSYQTLAKLIDMFTQKADGRN